MLRRLFTILSVISLLLCVATCVLWVRSYKSLDADGGVYSLHYVLVRGTTVTETAARDGSFYLVRVRGGDVGTGHDSLYDGRYGLTKTGDGGIFNSFSGTSLLSYVEIASVSPDGKSMGLGA